jgi:type IV pilus assembly protein PilW
MTPRLHSATSFRRRAQAGLSLIELLVGITIGLLVVVAAVGSLVYTRVSSTTVGDSSRLQQNAATAFRVIGHQVRQAGAQRVQTITGSTNVEFNPSFSGLGTTTFYVVQGTNGAATDTLNVSFDIEPNLAAADCLGKVATGASVTSSFSLVNGAIRCTGVASTGPLIEGAEDFQVWYGVRNGTTLQYQAAPALAASIEIVMICLRLAGEQSSNPGVATVGCNGENIAADGRIRRVFFRVFNLRNQGL